LSLILKKEHSQDIEKKRIFLIDLGKFNFRFGLTFIREIIPLKDIEAVQRKKPSTFCDKSLFYLEVSN